jgi:hypothetical protein
MVLITTPKAFSLTMLVYTNPRIRLLRAGATHEYFEAWRVFAPRVEFIYYDQPKRQPDKPQGHVVSLRYGGSGAGALKRSTTATSFVEAASQRTSAAERVRAQIPAASHKPLSSAT